MSCRSRSAVGAQTGRLAVGIFLARFPDNSLDIERPPLAPIEFAYADFNLCSQFGEGVDAFEQFAPELLLRPFGKLCCFRGREFEGFCHGCIVEALCPIEQARTGSDTGPRLPFS